MGVLDDLPRGVPGRTAREMRAPASVFENPDDIAAAKSLRYTPDKLFLGVINAQIERDPRTGERYAQGGAEIGVSTDQHAITIAASRTGKGRACIIGNMLRYAGSVLAIDPKGELATETAHARARMGQRVCVIDPFGTTGEALAAYRMGFNPLAMLTAGSPTLVVDAGLISDALVIAGGSDPHWDESARAFLEGVLLHVTAWPEYEGRRNLITVRDLITKGTTFTYGDESASGMRGLWWEMEACAAILQDEDPELGSLIAAGAADFFERPEREQGSVLSTVRRHTKFLDYPQLRASLVPDAAGEFDLTQLKTAPRGMSIYLCLPAGRMGTCNRWFRLFVNLALEAMEREKTKPDIPVLFVLDEFATLGHMRQLEDAAGQIAGFGVKLWPILQDLGQLKSLYKDRWETFMGNAGILQFFGNNDLTTLEWISKRLGSTTIEQRQTSSSDITPSARLSGAAGKGESFSPHTIPILQPDEIALVFGRADTQLRQLVILAGYRPMILQRAYYDKHAAFRGMR